MKYHEHKYDLIVVLGDNKNPPIWIYDEWIKIENEFMKLVKFSTKKAALRSTQYDQTNKKYISFGKISDLAGNKWCHLSPINKNNSNNWVFISTEMWVPSWNECEKTDMPPEVFIHIVNEKSNADNTVLFNPFIVIAIRSDVKYENDTIYNIKKILNANAFIHKNRQWGYKEFGGFSNSIQDLMSNSLFSKSNIHKENNYLEFINKEWKEI